MEPRNNPSYLFDLYAFQKTLYCLASGASGVTASCYAYRSYKIYCEHQSMHENIEDFQKFLEEIRVQAERISLDEMTLHYCVLRRQFERFRDKIRTWEEKFQL